MRDPVELEIFKSLFHSIAEEMGAALRRTAFSPNIKERRDYSCAVFDGDGEVVAMGDHMPVHLGSMPMSVRAAVNALTLGPGDVAILNDPFCGGTHLPDITLVAPVFLPSKSARKAGKRVAHEKSRQEKPAFYVASRAHHADVGGTYAGSMGICREIYQEGIRIPPVKLIANGELQQDILRLFLTNVRTPAEREGDLNAQIASCHTGATRLLEIAERYGMSRVRQVMDELQDYSEKLMRAFLEHVPHGRYEAEDFLDDDGAGSGPVRIAVAVTFAQAAKGQAHCDRGLHRQCAPGCRQHQCRGCDRVLSMLLCFSLSAAGRCSRRGGTDASSAHDCPFRNGGEFASTGCRCRRKR